MFTLVHLSCEEERSVFPPGTAKSEQATLSRYPLQRLSLLLPPSPSPLMDRADLAGHATATRGQAKQDPKSRSSKSEKKKEKGPLRTASISTMFSVL